MPYAQIGHHPLPIDRYTMVEFMLRGRRYKISWLLFDKVISEALSVNFQPIISRAFTRNHQRRCVIEGCGFISPPVGSLERDGDNQILAQPNLAPGPAMTLLLFSMISATSGSV
jgi:hypothetical protein